VSVYEQLRDDLGYLQWDHTGQRFAVLADQAAADGWSHVEYLARLVGEQAAHIREPRLHARLRYARFPYRRTIEDFDFAFQPSVDAKQVHDLATLPLGGRWCVTQRGLATGDDPIAPTVAAATCPARGWCANGVVAWTSQMEVDVG
jgi:hypothetical protein